MHVYCICGNDKCVYYGHIRYIQKKGDFKAGDEIWVDYLIVASTIYNFDEYDISNAIAGENVTVSIVASDDFIGANDSTTDAKDDADDKKLPLWIIAVVDVVVVATVVVVVVLIKKK